MLNQVCLVGRIVKDPEIRQAGQTNVCNFTLAVNRKFKKEGQPDSDFINCTVFGKTAEFMGNYIKKGYLLSVNGSLQTRSYDGQNGKVFVTEVMCDSVDNLTSKEPGKAKEKQQNDYDSIGGDINIDSSELPFY